MIVFTRINLSRRENNDRIEGINLRDCCSVDLVNCFAIDTLLMHVIYIYIYIFNVILADFIYRASESER